MRNHNRHGISALVVAVAASVATVGVTLSAQPSLAVPPSLRSVEDVQDLVAKSMQGLVAGDARGSYRLLSKYWPRPASELSANIVQAQRDRSATRVRLGLSLGWEELGIDRAGERVVRVRCLERLERGVLVWHFSFFRSDNIWQIGSVRSSDDLELAFGSAALFAQPPSATPPVAPSSP